MINIKSKYIIGWFAIFAIAALASCVSDEPRDGSAGNPFRVYLSFDGDGGLKSRAVIQSDMDKWTVMGFSNGDEVGLFAARKNNLPPYQNLRMRFVDEADLQGSGKQTFYGFEVVDENVDLVYADLLPTSPFIYFPYSANMTTTGLELRTLPANGVGPERCLDFLISTGMDASMLQDGILMGAMVHEFSELIILRGEGFDNPKVPENYTGDPDDAYKINVVLKKGYTHVKVSCTQSPWNCKVSLVESNDPATKSWEAWKGGNYSLTDADPVGREAWYVVLPTIGTGNDRAQVDYIELYDNEGVLQTIKDLYLDGATKNYLTSQWRYPMEIRMQELVPTIFPFSVEKWNEDNTITNKRQRGIYANTFENWLELYGTYLKSNRTTNEEALKSYGDATIVNGSTRWHFYIFDDLDYSSLSQISELQDTLDGKTAPLASPISINRLTKPMINKLSGPNAAVMNMVFKEPQITIDTPTQAAAGCVVNTNDGGTMENCNVVQGYLSAKVTVGMICGSTTGGKLNGCSATGVIFGASSNSENGYLIGDYSEGFVPAGNSSSVIFTRNWTN